MDEKKIFAIIENRNDDLIYKKAQIELFFRSHPDEAERAEYLRSAYQDRFTEILADGARLGYRPQKNGLLMWEGAYLSRTSETVFSWGLVAGFTAQLIDKREYYVNTEIKPFVPMESQQLTLFDMPAFDQPEDTPVAPLFSHPKLPQQIIDEALCVGANDEHSRLIICAYFMKDKPDNAAFLQKHYGENGAGFYFDGEKISLWYDAEGMRIARGTTAQRSNATRLSWEEAAKRIRELLDLGRYMPQSELDEVEHYERMQLADSIAYTSRDITKEAREAGFLPLTMLAHSVKGGYPEVQKQIYGLLCEPDTLQKCVDEWEAFNDALDAGQDLLRFRGYRPKEILQRLRDLQREPLHFTVADGFAPDRQFFISADEVDKVLRGGYHSTDYRLGVYAFYATHKDTPKADGSFNVYDDLRQKLLEMGIPENEIAYIHTANTEQKKKELFAKVRGGEVRILMGSTAKMGAGTNVQDRLIALHDLDCPWRPSDLQQRLGRIVRQGNQNPEVEIFRYVTEGTFDAYLYQLVESKQRFIAQIMTSKAPARAAEDVDETALSYAEIKALATGNPQIIEKCNLDMEVSKLNMLRANHLSQRYALEELVLRKYPAEIKELNERIAGYEQDSTHLAEHPKPDEGIAPMVLDGVTYTERENAGKAIIEACTHMNGAEVVSIGSYRGFSMLLSYDGAANEFRMVLKGKLSHTAVLGADAGGNVTRIDNALEKITEHLANARSQLAHTTEQLENARTEMTAPFPKEAKLAEKTRRLNELNVLLNLNEQDRPVMADEPDEGDRIRPKAAERER